MLTKEAQAKLLKLADFLEKNVKDEWFDLIHWATAGFTKKRCGTVACAMGWATVCFPDSGLDLIPNASPEGPMVLALNGDEFVGPQVPMEFFGINMAVADYLFMPFSYADDESERMDVVERLREFATTGVYYDSYCVRREEELEQ